jgi:hypothetical protein
VNITPSARFGVPPALASAYPRASRTSGDGGGEGARREADAGKAGPERAREDGPGEGGARGARGETASGKARAGNEWVSLGAAARLWRAYGGEALVDIGQEVVRRLDAHRQPDE